MSIGKDISFLFSPQSIAIVGASPIPGKPSFVVLESLRKIGFEGAIYPVNPRYRVIDGLKCYSSLDEIVDTIDLAVLILPAPNVLEILRGPVDNVKGAVIVSAGFKEVESGKKLEAEIEKILLRKNIRIVGPNCMGIYDTVSKVDTFFVPEVRVTRPGKGGLSILSQSGSFAVMVMGDVASAGFGVSRVVSYGNGVDVNVTDCVDFLADDEATEVVALYVESIEDGKKFVESASRCAEKKPVVALKVGRGETGSRAAKSHTGAMSGNYEIYRAAFKKAGIIEVDGYEGLKDACKVLGAYLPIREKKALIVTDGGGVGISMADALEISGLEVPSLSGEAKRQLGSKLPEFSAVNNPIDLTGSVSNSDYVTALDQGLEDGCDFSIVVVLWGPAELTEDLVERLDEVRRKHDKPLIICSPGGDFAREMAKRFEEKGIPVFSTPESAVRAASVLTSSGAQVETGKIIDGVQTSEKAEKVKRAKSAKKARMGRDAAKKMVKDALIEGRVSLLEPEAKALVSAWGIDVPKSVLIKKPEDLAKAENLRPPFALKVVSLDVIHKTEVGGVELDIKNLEDTARTLEEMKRNFSKGAPRARVEGFLLEEMAPKGAEVIVGGLKDPQFGPVVMFGLGGIATELFKDVTFRLAPLEREEAFEMMKDVKTYPLLTGFRGSKPVDLENLATIIMKMSEIVQEIEEINEIEINPLQVHEKVASAVDVRVILGESSSSSSSGLNLG